jgi:hypothetical protein
MAALEVIGVRRSMLLGLLLLLLLLLLVGLAAPTWAQATQTSEALVVLAGPADVPRASRSAT